MLQEIWQSWVAVTTRPEQLTFDQERSRATMEKALLGIVIAGVISGVLGAVRLATGLAALSLINIPTTYDKELGEIPGFNLAPLLPVLSAAAAGWGVLVAPIGAVIGLLLFSGIIYVFAVLLKGRGTFTTQTYLLSIFWAPLTIISAAAGLVPCLGGMVSGMLFLYSFYPLTLAIASAHEVTAGRAIAIWAIPLGIVVALTLCAAFAIAAAIAYFIVGVSSGPR